MSLKDHPGRSVEAEREWSDGKETVGRRGARLGRLPREGGDYSPWVGPVGVTWCKGLGQERREKRDRGRTRSVRESATSLIKAGNPTERSRVVVEGRCHDQSIRSLLDLAVETSNKRLEIWIWPSGARAGLAPEVWSGPPLQEQYSDLR